MSASAKLVLTVTTVSLLASSIFTVAQAGDFILPGQAAAPHWLPNGRIGGNDLRPRPDILRPLRPNLPNLPGNIGRPGGGGQPGNVGIINNHHHHYYDHGAIAAAAIGGLALGAVAATAASHHDVCRYPVYNRRGHLVGYRRADCDYEE